MGSTDVGQALFISMGMRKEKWPEVNTWLIEGFLENFELLDNEDNELFVDCFHFYNDWWNRNQLLTS